MKKKIALILGCVLCLGSTMSVSAAEYSSPTDDAEVPLTFTKNSYFTVTLPEAITGSNGVSSVDFDYSVEGDIASDEKVTVNLVDDNSSVDGAQFVLSDVTGQTKDANISIPKTDFAYDEITTKLTKTGNVTVEDLEAGSWSGVAKFLINLESTQQTVEAGLYSDSGVMLASWNDLVGTYGLRVGNNYASTSAASADTTSLAYIINNNSELAGASSVVLGDDVESIGDYALSGCSSIRSISIPETVTSVGSYAFANSGVSSMTLPRSITSVGDYAYYNCSSITSVGPVGSGASVEIPDTVTSLGQQAFYYCKNLQEVNLPDSISEVGEYAFAMCSSLESIAIPDGVTTLGRGIFQNCTSLQSAYIPASVTAISQENFLEGSGSSGVVLTQMLFYKCPSTAKIYCGAPAKQSGWSDYWNAYTGTLSTIGGTQKYSDIKKLSVVYNVTKADYEANYR